MIVKADFNGSPHIGVFCLVNDNYAFVPHSITPKLEHALKTHLSVDIVRTTIAGTSLLGVFVSLCNSKAIIPDIAEKEEIKVFKDRLSEVVVLKEKFAALGNLITINDHGAICSRYVKNAKDIPAKHVRVAGSDLVGSAVFANNIGFLAHRDASQKELEEIEAALKVKGDVGTLNFGDPLVKSGILANKHGVILGRLTSGPEMQRVDEVFMLK